MTPMMDMRRARRMAIMLSVTYVFIHSFLFLFFRHYGVVPMARFNVFSVAFYIVLFIVSLKGFISFFPMAVYLEVVVHMTAATYFTGWESGFQTTLIAMCVLIAYAEYLGHALKMRTIKTAPLCMIGMVIYLALCVVMYHRSPPYPLPEEVCHWMQLFWGVVIFSVMTAFLHAFVRFTVRSEAFLAERASHDNLTGLPNRYFMMDHLEAIRGKNDLSNHWIAILDIDDFKLINDTYGHNCGDAILKQISELLTQHANGFTACRWGGEEFLLAGRINAGTDACVEQLEALRRLIMDNRFVYADIEVRLTITIGYKEYRDGMSIEAWIDGADRNLYTGKSNGKNQVVYG